MITAAYVDSSVILRLVLRQAPTLAEFADIDHLVTSEVARVECSRVLDRMVLASAISPVDHAIRRKAALDLLGEMERVRLDQAVLDRAAEPFPSAVGTLDAMHLATAILWERSSASA